MQYQKTDKEGVSVREKLRIIIFGMLFLLGSASLFVFQIYIQPKLNTKEVVIVHADIPKNQILTSFDVGIYRISSDGLPKGYLNTTTSVIGKKTNVDLPQGTVLSPELIDIDNMNPSAGEMIFPIPRVAIYAVNASLRAGDYVSISLYRLESREQNQDQSLNQGGLNQEMENHDEETEDHQLLSLKKSVRVIAVRSDAGNMVRDTDKGNTNDRLTSTERIGHLELLLTFDEAKYLETKIRGGYQVWASRVEGSNQ